MVWYVTATLQLHCLDSITSKCLPQSLDQVLLHFETPDTFQIPTQHCTTSWLIRVFAMDHKLRAHGLGDLGNVAELSEFYSAALAYFTWR